MRSLTSSIEALLTKAQADAAAGCREFEDAIELYERALQIDSSVIDAEQLARLFFVTEKWEQLNKIIPSVSNERQGVWQTILEARNGGDIIWPELTQPSPWDLAYRGYLLSLQDRFGEAKELWMEYLMNVQSSWEHEFLSRIWLKQEPTQCVACREKPAIACFGEGGFLCFECRAFLEDESAFMEIMSKGGDPEKERLIENMTGEPFEAQGPLAYTDYESMPNWKWAPEEPLLEVMDIPTLLECLDEQARACWARARELSGSTGVLQSSHLWSAVCELPDSQLEPICQPELGLLRDAVPGNNDLRWVLNLARWSASLFPFRGEGMIRPLDLLLALSWSLSTKLRVQAVRRAVVCEIASAATQLKVFERLLEDRPDDLYLRVMVSRRHDGVERSVLLERMLWFIREHPEHMAGCGVGPGLGEPSAQRAVLDVWCEAVRSQPERVGALVGLADFCSFEQTHLALELSRRTAELEPAESDHAYNAGQLCHTLAERSNNPELAAGYFAEAVSWMEQASLWVEPECRSQYLSEALDFALEGELWSKVESLAHKLLVDSGEDDFDGEFQIHRARTALAQAALGRGDLASAKDHFLDSVGRVWYPELDGYSPSFELAQKFQDLGDRELVLQYLSLCRKFWSDGTTLLDQWTHELKSGKNLVFPTREEISDLVGSYGNFDESEDWDD